MIVTITFDAFRAWAFRSLVTFIFGFRTVLRVYLIWTNCIPIRPTLMMCVRVCVCVVTDSSTAVNA